MITHMQAARLKAANHLKAAAAELAQAWGLECFDEATAKHLDYLRSQIESDFSKLVPNEKVLP